MVAPGRAAQQHLSVHHRPAAGRAVRTGRHRRPGRRRGGRAVGARPQRPVPRRQPHRGHARLPAAALAAPRRHRLAGRLPQRVRRPGPGRSDPVRVERVAVRAPGHPRAGRCAQGPQRRRRHGEPAAGAPAVFLPRTAHHRRLPRPCAARRRGVVPGDPRRRHPGAPGFTGFLAHPCAGHGPAVRAGPHAERPPVPVHGDRRR